MKKLTKVIGIISYLPEDNKLREVRKQKLLNNLKSCLEIFNINIIIIAQNWDDDFCKKCFDLCKGKLTVERYEKGLGITQARLALRNMFLNTGFDYLIMFDDDEELVGTREQGKKFLNIIDKHPGCYGMFKYILCLSGFSISKEIFSKVTYVTNLTPEDKTLFEDMFLINLCKYLFIEKEFNLDDCGIQIQHDGQSDLCSTWRKSVLSTEDCNRMNSNVAVTVRAVGDYLKNLEETK